jgi:ABC-type spermidine/putrescine transport system permease subunit II
VNMFRRHPVVSILAVLTIVFMWLPLVVVIGNSFNGDPILATWGGLTLKWFEQAIRDEQVRTGLVTSLQVGLLTAAASLIVALTGVLWWRQASPQGRRAFDVSVYARLVLPEVVFATALFLVFTRGGIQLGMMTTVIGHTVWASAYAAVILQARARLLDPAVEEAAADLGASPLGVFFRVTLRGMLPAVVRRRRHHVLPERTPAQHAAAAGPRSHPLPRDAGGQCHRGARDHVDDREHPAHRMASGALDAWSRVRGASARLLEGGSP